MHSARLCSCLVTRVGAYLVTSPTHTMSCCALVSALPVFSNKLTLLLVVETASAQAQHECMCLVCFFMRWERRAHGLTCVMPLMPMRAALHTPPSIPSPTPHALTPHTPPPPLPPPPRARLAPRVRPMNVHVCCLLGPGRGHVGCGSACGGSYLPGPVPVKGTSTSVVSLIVCSSTSSLTLSYPRWRRHVTCRLQSTLTSEVLYRIIRMRTSVTCGYDRTRVQSAAREGRCPKRLTPYALRSTV